MDWSAYEHHAPSGSWIAKDFAHGAGFDHGLQCIIDPDVVVGADVRLGHRVHLASGTRVLDDVEIADDCVTTGICLIGNHVRVRTGSCVSKSVIVDDWCFIAARHHELAHQEHRSRPSAGAQAPAHHPLRLRLGDRQPGPTRAPASPSPSAIVGYGSHVVLDLEVPNAVYYNKPNPWAELQFELAPDNPAYIEIPAGYVPHEFDPALLTKYLPHYRP